MVSTSKSKKPQSVSKTASKTPKKAPARKRGSGRHILVLHGPNLNSLGTREPEIYGHATLADIDGGLKQMATKAGAAIECFQSNHEGELIDRVQQAGKRGISFIIINAASYTHTSIGLRDALAAADLPFIEVHLSNVFARETFRHHSLLSDLAVGMVCGLGAQGYQLALQFVLAQP
jgi:3-dehydroquinate dehydratase-2